MDRGPLAGGAQGGSSQRDPQCREFSQDPPRLEKSPFEAPEVDGLEWDKYRKTIGKP